MPCVPFSPVFHRFPLYPRGERFHFEYGVYLLNKNIAQVIYEHTYSAQMFTTNVWMETNYNTFDDLKVNSTCLLLLFALSCCPCYLQ